MTNSDFLAAIYGTLEAGEFGWVANFRASPNDAPPGVWAGRPYRGSPAQAAVIDGAGDDNTYFCTAVLTLGEGGQVQRRKECFRRLAALVVDDVDPEDVQTYSWALQTSPGQHQVGILLDPADADCADRELVDKVMSALAARGRSNDSSGNACVRYVRLPVGSNTKPRAAGIWRVQLASWSPNVRWSLEDACAAVGIDLDGLRAIAAVGPVTSSPGTGAHAGEMLSLLSAPVGERAYHDSITRLAASLIAGGMFPGAAVDLLYSLMDEVKPGGPLEEVRRWEARRAEIPRAVKSAEKFAPENRRPPEITVNLSLPSLQDEPAPAPGDLQPMDWDELSVTAPEPTTWRLQGWLPAGTVTLLSANGGVGKSNLSLQLAVSIALGRPFLGMDTQAARVLVISAEDEARTVHFRVANICADLGLDMSNLTGRLTVFDLTQADCVLWSAGAATPRMQWLADRVVRCQADVVIIDNASDVFNANENDRAEVRGFMRCLNRVAHATRAAMLLLAHVDKASVRSGAGMDSNTTFSGSTAWNNSARSRWAMYRDDAAVVVRHEKCNLGPLQDEIRLEFDTDAKVFRHYGQVVSTQLSAAVMRNAQRAAILRMIGRAANNGANLSLKQNSPNNIYKALADDPDYPPRLSRRQFFEIVRELEDERLIEHIEYRKSNRTDGHRIVLTDRGETLAAMNSGASRKVNNETEGSNEDTTAGI